MSGIITTAEVGLLEEKMQELSPGYKMLDFSALGKSLIHAADQWKGDSTLFDQSGQMNQARLMRRVLTDPKREGYGVPFPWWWTAFDYRLFPGLRQDPWNEVKWWIYEELRGKRQNVTFHGAQNSLKTAFMGRFAALNMAVWLQHCRIYVSGPHKNAAEDKVWGDSLKPSLEKIKKPGNPFADSLLLRVDINGEDCAIFDVITGESATARFVALENAAQVQGKKAVEHDGAGMIGVTAFIVDEFIENPGIKLKQAEGNLSSNHNYIGFFSCNPMPAKVQQVGMLPFSEPVEIERSLMRKETSFRWRTRYGFCYRFAWQNCPNNILGRTVWPYMLNKEMVTSGASKDADIVAAQLDAWGWTTTGISFLDEAAVRLAGTYSIPAWRSARTRFMAVDCGFGGGDPATFTALEAGNVDLPDDWRKPVNKHVFGGVIQDVLDVTGDFEFTTEWFRHMLDLFEYSGGGFPDSIRIAPFTEGQLIPASYMLLQRVLEAMIEHAIPPGNVTYDSSQRGDCTTIMNAGLGRGNVKYFYEGTRSLATEEQLLNDAWAVWPFEYEKTDDQGHKLAKKWTDLCSRVISMQWMFACNFIRHGNVINGGFLKRGIEELIARPIEAGKKSGISWRRDVMSKADLKAAGMKSPTWGEGLSLAIYFGVRFLGLCPIGRPELTTTIEAVSQIGDIISAGKSRRFSLESKGWMNERR